MRYEDMLQSNSPATDWSECYPLGNGNIGVMDYGNPIRNTIALNDDQLWSGYGANKNNQSRGEKLKEIREALDNNDFSRAETLTKESLLGGWTESYLPLGNITVQSNIPSYEAYKRVLDMSQGVETVSFTSPKGEYLVESFVSEPAKCYVKYCTCPTKTNFTFAMDSELKYCTEAHKTEHGAELVMDGIAPSVCLPIYQKSDNPVVYDDEHPGKEFVCKLEIITDGEININQNKIDIVDCTYYQYVMTTEVKFASNKDLQANCDKKIEQVLSRPYKKVLERHIQDHSSLYNRCFLDLGGEDTNLTTEELLKNNKKLKNNKLITMLFNFGRYLTIAGSREGSNATNLQGIWNDILRAPWASNYTININTEMNYWPTLKTGLVECYEPLIHLIRKVYKNGQKTASETFGMRGWVCGHNTDCWGQSNPVGGTASDNSCTYGLLLGGSGWLCSHIYAYYKYTLDKDFLKENFDIMLDAARFYLDYLYLDQSSGKLICGPSNSPENTFMKKGWHAVCKASAMDMTIITELFHSILECSEILGYEDKDGIITEISEALPKLYPVKINGAGRVQEWNENYKETVKTHRHLSHLYGLFPSSEWTFTKTPEYMAAAAKSLKRRGIAGTGWSLAWKANCFARLHDSKSAYKAIMTQLTYVKASKSIVMKGGGSFGSLLCAHPPFQIDGNFGVTSAICEMIMQSHDDCIELLPAVPKEWSKGKARGLVAEGGYTVDVEWFENRLVSYTIYHPTKETALVKIKGNIQEVKVSKPQEA